MFDRNTRTKEVSLFCFFFQAEDGIRDLIVTGVQTCALPICVIAGGPWRQQRDQQRRESRIDKAQAELKRLAAVKRKKVDVQKLASQVGRSLQRQIGRASCRERV